MAETDAELKIRRGSVAVELWVGDELPKLQFDVRLPSIAFEDLKNIRIVIDKEPSHHPRITIDRAEETVQVLQWDDAAGRYESERGGVSSLH